MFFVYLCICIFIISSCSFEKLKIIYLALIWYGLPIFLSILASTYINLWNYKVMCNSFSPCFLCSHVGLYLCVHLSLRLYHVRILNLTCICKRLNCLGVHKGWIFCCVCSDYTSGWVHNYVGMNDPPEWRSWEQFVIYWGCLIQFLPLPFFHIYHIK